jgi:hypothetical protein
MVARVFFFFFWGGGVFRGCWIFYIKLSIVFGSGSHLYPAPSISITILPAKQIDLDQLAMVIFFLLPTCHLCSCYL